VNRQLYPTGIKKGEWRIIQEFMAATKATGRPREQSYREIMNGIFYILCNGINRIAFVKLLKRVVTGLLPFNELGSSLELER
jgi:transposase